MSDIEKDSEYKASLKKLDAAIAEHLKVIEQFGNQAADSTPDASILTGWVLVLNTMVYNPDEEAFEDAMVEMADGMSRFTALGLTSYAHAFMKDRVDNYSIED